MDCFSWLKDGLSQSFWNRGILTKKFVFQGIAILKIFSRIADERFLYYLVRRPSLASIFHPEGLIFVFKANIAFKWAH